MTPRPSPEALIQRLREWADEIEPGTFADSTFSHLRDEAVILRQAADALASSQEALQQDREKSERVFQAVVYAFEGKPVPPDLEAHGMVNRGRKHWEASQEALRAAERAHADEIADMMRELESTAELACRQGRDALKEQHRAEAAERGLRVELERKQFAQMTQRHSDRAQGIIEDNRDYWYERAITAESALQANEQEIARVKADAYAEGVSQERARMRAAIEQIELKELLRDVDVSDASS
jgi:hypothetical protein